MENRFGLKDAILIGLLVLTLASIWLWMIMRDRQHETLDTLASSQKQLADDLQLRTASLEREIGRIASRPVESPRVVEALTSLQAAITAMAQNQVDPAEFQAQLAAIQRQIDESRAATQDTPATPAGADNPFERILEPRDREDFAFGGWMVDSFRQNVGKLTPLVATDVYQSIVEGYVLEPLITRDPETLEWKPWIARRWEVSEDGKTITYWLRDNVTFADGEPLTAEDVVFTYNLIMNPRINTPRLRSYYEKIESVEADGPHKVVYKLTEPYFLALSITGGLAIMPEHWYRKFTPEEFNEQPGLLFGSGPYRLEGDPEDWQSGTGDVTLVRNEKYWGPRGVFDRLVWQTITDENAELIAFRNGEIDRYGISPEQYPRLSKDADLLRKAELYVYNNLAGGYRYIGWNQKRGGRTTPFADARVRRAMTMLINREELAQQLMSGLATVATGPFHPLGDQADPAIEPWPYDPQRAKELLAEAGYRDIDNDSVLEGPGGEDFTFSLIYPSSSEFQKQMALYLKDAFARAGIALRPEPTEWNTMLQRIDERDFDAITLGWGGSIETDPNQIFTTSAIAEGGDNYVQYSNPELDRLIEQARITVDDEKRTDLWHRVHRILHEDQPYTFLFNQKSAVFVTDRLHNVEKTKVGLNDRLEYFIPAPLQRR